MTLPNTREVRPTLLWTSFSSSSLPCHVFTVGRIDHEMGSCFLRKRMRIEMVPYHDTEGLYRLGRLSKWPFSQSLPFKFLRHPKVPMEGGKLSYAWESVTSFYLNVSLVFPRTFVCEMCIFLKSVSLVRSVRSVENKTDVLVRRGDVQGPCPVSHVSQFRVSTGLRGRVSDTQVPQWYH
jgi:hypothetical protein